MKHTEKDLNNNPNCDILNMEISSQEDDEVALARFHNENTIYLYCVTDRLTANNAINGKVTLPIKLYEMRYIAEHMSKNVNLDERIALRFAIALNADNFYDEFLMPAKLIKNKTKLRSKQFKSKCSYLRTLNKEDKVIEYEIKDMRCIINVQII